MKLKVVYNLHSRGSRQVSSGFHSFTTNYKYWVEASARDEESGQNYLAYSFNRSVYPGAEELAEMKKEARTSLITIVEKEIKSKLIAQSIEEVLSPEEIEI